MKLLRLDLLRYGHLSDVCLNFPDAAALQVVHGANEAGKSTALAAIADALFGFPERTAFDYLHRGPQLRVGFAVSARDGSTGAFVRRKGRRDTLSDADEQVVPEDVLRRFLGGASRELFERGFGLDGARLRAGGQELLRSGGDAGESLFAGAGLLNLHTALAALEEEAKSLVGDGRGRRRLSEAIETWRQAQRASEERSVAPRAWQEAEAAGAATTAELARVQEETRALAAEGNRLQRVRRVAPLLAELNAARDAFATLADAPELAPEIETRRAAAVEARREAQRDAERETAEATRLTQALAALPQDAVVLTAQDAIDALVAQRSVALQAADDLPKVRARVVSHRATVAIALEELGTALSPEAARNTIPAAGLRRAVQRLVSRRAALAATAASAGESLATARRRRDQAAVALQAAVAPRPFELLRRTTDEVRGEGPLDHEYERVRRALTEAEMAADAALARLPLWHGDMAGLIACRLPLVAETDAVASGIEAAAKAVAEARAVLAGLVKEIAAREAEVSRLAHGETVPTPAIVAAARLARDGTWRLIRRVLEGGSIPGPPGALPDEFETLRDEADRLADRRADDAQRVADFLAVTARLDLLGRQRVEAAAALAAAEAAAADVAAVWRALWAPSDVDPGTPPGMTEWRRARDDILRLAEAAAEARSRCDDVTARRARAIAALAALLSDVTEQATLAALLLRAETECKAVETEAAAYRALMDALAREEVRLPALQDAANAAADALAAWQDDWAKAVAALGLPENASVDAAEAALDAWARVDKIAPAWREDEQRITDMAASIEAFAGMVRAVQVRLSEPASDEPDHVRATRLVRRLADARKAANEAASLTERIAAHGAAAAGAARRLHSAEAELETLRMAAGAADDAALERAIERAKRRDAATGDIARIERALLAQGDGLTEQVLRGEAAGAEPDAVVARLAEIAAELAALGERRELLSAERTRAEAKLAEMRDGHDAAAKAQEAQDALAEARAAAERYARLHVARVLLRSGIDRFREEQQGPRLRAAGAHFALLTGGRYVRLGVDQNAAGDPVLRAIRDDGTECPVEALSEGTRDQLYLALRVAAIEDHAAKAEPLPFIADDLLVQFDDARAAAAIALLAELGRTAQVILFTHHDHIAALAAGQAGVAVHHLPLLIVPATAAMEPV